MSDDLLEAYIVQQIAMTPGDEILFSWHGGEPTILGIDYFRRIVELQRTHRPTGKRVANSIQTNGVLLTDSQEHQLDDGDRIEMGEVLFIFRNR